MKPFEELTCLGQLCRLRKAACQALDAYALSNPDLEFITRSENTTYRVKEKIRIEPSRKKYKIKKYLLRIHRSGY